MLFFRKEVQGPYEKAAALADEVLFAIRTVVPRTLVRWHDVFSGFFFVESQVAFGGEAWK